MRRVMVFLPPKTAPTPTPAAPSPAPPTPASPFAFASVDEHLYKFYVIRLKNEKATVVCLESSPDFKALAGPFDAFAEAKEAEIKLNS